MNIKNHGSRGVSFDYENGTIAKKTFLLTIDSVGLVSEITVPVMQFFGQLPGWWKLDSVELIRGAFPVLGDVRHFAKAGQEIRAGEPVYLTSEPPINDALANVMAVFKAKLSVAGRPFQIDPRWRTSTVVDIIEGIRETNCSERFPILADALLDAGCDDGEFLAFVQRHAGSFSLGGMLANDSLGTLGRVFDEWQKGIPAMYRWGEPEPEIVVVIKPRVIWGRPIFGSLFSIELP